MPFTFEESPGGLEAFLIRKSEEIDVVLLESAHRLYAEVKQQLAPHLNNEKTHAKKGGESSDHPLARAINESEESTVIEEFDPGVLSVGVGNIETLESDAPHWKYLEYGTYDYREASDWGPPPVAPKSGDTSPAEKDGRKGIAPNRAWRHAREIAGEIVGEALVERGFHPGRGI